MGGLPLLCSIVFAARVRTAIDSLVAGVPNAPTLKQSILSHHTSAEDAGRVARAAGVKAAEHLAHPDMEALMSAAIAQSSVPLPSEGKGALIIRPTAASRRSVGQPES